MAYHRYICHKSYPDGTRFQPEAPSVDFSTEPFPGFRAVVEGNNTTFTAVVAALSCFGNVDFTGRKIHGFLPKPGYLYDHEAPVTVASSSRFAKRKRTADGSAAQDEILAITSALNPFTVHLGNLRKVVRELSNPDVPEEFRRNFIDRNPLPGANFDGAILLNPDDIMPEVYNDQHLAADFRALRVCVDIASKRYASWFGTVNLSGKACSGTFVNMENTSKIESGLPLSGRIRHTCPERIAANHYLLGFISCVGEHCQVQGHAYETYGSRRLQSGITTMDLNWDQLVEGLYH